MKRKAFVAYSYRLYTGKEYRECFARVGSKYGVDFVYADLQTTRGYIFTKIRQMIRESTFAVFDTSDWNANVTLELGFALGIGVPSFILIDPSKSTGGIPEAPADLRGLDRIQYNSMESLESGLSRLMEQLFGRDGPASLSFGEVIYAHVRAELEGTIKEQELSPDRDTSVSILPSGRVLPLEGEILVTELPMHVTRIPEDPFHPRAPVGPWITSRIGKIIALGIGLCVAFELASLVLFPSTTLGALAAFVLTLPAAAWFAFTWRKRRAFEHNTPYSITYRRPATRPLGPYFVWNFSDPADPDDPRVPARVGDPRAVRVEIRRRKGDSPGVQVVGPE